MNIFFIYSLLFPFIHSFFYASSIASFSASVYYNMRSDRNQFLSPDPSSTPPWFRHMTIQPQTSSIQGI